MPKSFQNPVPANTLAAESQPAESGVNGASVETVAPRQRRRFSAAEKLRLVKAADAALASGERGALAALLRREGIYSSQLSTWRSQLGAHGAAGLHARKPGRKGLDEKDRQLLAANKELAKLKRELDIANGLLDLQKKAHELLGLAMPQLDEKS